ncbi:MAG: VCBS repeat-containing protein [Kofleriaceae bacterium]|nr:VCBS repeat-containing protein [Kofleriaceae bacterium]
MRRLLIATLLLGCVPGCVMYLNPLCDDRIRNGDETDIDCGGTCGACEVGDRCYSDRDCGEGTCSDERCAPHACANGVQDVDETDVDCGGSTCRKCSGGHACASNADCFSDDCVSSTGRCFELPVVQFRDAVRYPTGTKAYMVRAGDLDADGDLDLFAANELDSTITVLRNEGLRTGTFATLPPPTEAGFPTGAYPTGGAIADFNVDGVADVITADYHGNSVTISLGWGSGDHYTLLAPGTFPTVAGAETSNLAVGDLDGDGLPDVIATNPQASSASIFLGRGDGTLGRARDEVLGIAGISEPYSVAIGDYDGNGTQDAAIADNTSASVFVLLGNGDGTFSQGPNQPALDGLPSFIIITHDVNLDGILDLVCANRSSDDVSVLLGRGDGGFRRAIVSSTGAGTGPYSVAIADFNVDGVPDVVTANFMSDTGSVLLGVGDGSFEAPIDAGLTGNSSYGVAAGDFNGDGKPDFAVANALSNDVAVKISRSY